MPVLNLRLADCPTAVLVQLVRAAPGSVTVPELVRDAAPADVEQREAIREVSRALRLLIDLGFAELDRESDRGSLYRATADGRAVCQPSRAAAMRVLTRSSSSRRAAEIRRTGGSA